jgi:hypothetical protein
MNDEAVCRTAPATPGLSKSAQRVFYLKEAPAGGVPEEVEILQEDIAVQVHTTPYALPYALRHTLLPRCCGESPLLLT